MINQIQKNVFSQTELEVAEQLVQMSKEDTISCSRTYESIDNNHTTHKQEDVASSRNNDMVGNEKDDDVGMLDKNVKEKQSFVETKRRMNKKIKFRSLASIYRATKEII
ncbi:unnamed protein product [Cochlearia groenlandica]